MLAAAALAASCSRAGGTPPEFRIRETARVPAAFFGAAPAAGRVERIEYASRDYTREDGGAVRKPAFVYLPPGYSETNRHDVIYLLHGWTGVAEEFFGRPEWPVMKNLFDNLVARGRCRPFIAVAPTWDRDNRAKDWDESTREAAVFHREYVADLIPAVEGRYATWAEATDEAGIAASRAHRALGGFSLGAITTWHVFEHAFPATALYLPMSGDNWHVEMFGGATHPEETADFLASLVAASPYRDDFRVWYAVGSRDVRLPQTHNQALAMAARPGVFGPGHFSYWQKPGGRHDLDAVLEFLYNALPQFFPPDAGEPAAPAAPDEAAPAPYTRDTPVAEVAADPALAPWGRLLFPAQRGYWSGRTLGELDLAWYSCIDPDKTVEICNHARARAAAGDTFFLDLYTDAEKAADPAKRDTGLFFFRGRPGAPFAIVNAGGGFAYVGAMHDSFPHALELSKRGVNAFALVYRPGARTACEDLARAIRTVFDRAAELGVSTDGYSLWGGSAGARMAAWLGSLGTAAFGERDLPRPAAVVMQYTGLAEWRPGDPATYAVCGDRDGIASWRTMKRRLDEMSAAGIPTRFRLAPGLAHGFGLGTGTPAEGWLDDALAFWNEQRKDPAP